MQDDHQSNGPFAAPVTAAQLANGPETPLGIVAVGASAGGLEAYQRLVQSLTPSTRQAYVLIQHLDPTYESRLPELLARHARLPVRSITDGTRVEANHVYLIPAGSQLRIEHGVLRLSEFESPRGQRRPIDTFFESLAADRGADCAAVVLSGTGSDGSIGLEAVKEAGGLVVVQDPAEAKYDGMPSSALATNAADFVLPAGDIATVVAEYFERRRGLEPALLDDDAFVAKVTQYVRYRTGHDFSRYKRATLLRRIMRRMNILDLASPADYVQHLITARAEASTLFRELLINVTGFFRDPEVFADLRRTVIPELVAAKSPGEEVRIWVPGCSSGQEAYTLAMLLHDEMERQDSFPRARIFATDIDDESLHLAREGVYPAAIADEISADHLTRYFTSTPDGYRITSVLRDLVRISNHDLVKDPPFSRIDFISCRNLLIYFSDSLQRDVIPIFHYALRPGGRLLLGPSENISRDNAGFSAVDTRRKLYRRDAAPSAPLERPFAGLRQSLSLPDPGLPRPPVGERETYQDAILEHHAPPYVVIDPARRIVHASARTGPFLELPEGALSADVIDFAKGQLKPALRALIAGSGPDAPGLRHQAFEGTIDGEEPRSLVLTLQRLADGRSLIVFQDRFLPTGLEPATSADAPGTASETEVRRLEQELAESHQTIRTTVEELETSNEELKGSNEEMMSMNEELQSANEELSTINEELQNKIAELNAANDDIRNLISASQIAIVFLDNQLRVRNFTPESTHYFRFDGRDLGRPIEEIHAEFDRAPLLDAAQAVLADREPRALEFRTSAADRDVKVQLAPYLTSSDEIAGVVFTFTQVTELREYARNLEAARRDAANTLAEIEHLYRRSPQALALLDRNLRYVRVNERLAGFNGGAPIEAHAGRRIDEMLPDIDPAMIAAAEQVLETGEPVTGLTIRTPTGDDPPLERIWEVDWFPAFDDAGALDGIGLSVTDVTHHKEMEEELRRLMRELQHRVKNMLANVTALINQARRQAGETPEVMETLAKRIRALANTHNLLTTTNWRPAPLRDVLLPELIEVYGSERVSLAGPEIRLGARATLGMSMVVHELSTNAAKYGSLSAPEGTIEILWQRADRGDGEKFIFEWIERGGPAVNAPVKTGYGSDLIDLTVRGTLGGTIEKFFEPLGLRCVVIVPIEKALGDGRKVDQPRVE